MAIETQMWTERYRPSTLDEVVGHDVITDRLKRFLDPEDGGGLPHSIFAGPPGTGKTASAMAYAQDFYGRDWRENVREFNASDERGIDVVRDKIKQWCRTQPTGDYPYKIVFLDEADQLTTDAQPALRRTMEQFSDNTRFILTCNYVNEIHDALQSRCATFYFGALESEEIRTVVQRVADGEGIAVEDHAMDAIVRSSRGRARNAIVTLRMSVVDGEVTEADVEAVTGVVDDSLVVEILQMALDGELDDAMTRFDVELLKSGADPTMLIDSLLRVIRNKIDLPPDQRVKCIELLATIDERVHAGLNPHVNFHALLGHVYVAQGLSVYEQQGDSDA